MTLVFVSLCGPASAASLELGHVRAKRRGWAEVENSAPSKTTKELAAFEEVEVEMTEDTFQEEEEEVHAHELTEFDEPPSESNMTVKARLKRVRSSVKRLGGLVLIGRGTEKKPTLREGYLAVDAPPALRFSDIDPVNDRPPSPALPEFNFVASEYMPYLIESGLSEDELNNAAMLSEIVIEMAPHEIVSGKIETRSRAQEEMVEHFDLDEQRSSVLRPEEVLIYFETDTNGGKTGAMVPFSPATPSTNTIKSSATLTKEK
ncbi:hypothetical protein [Pelagicoccus sp. SDUM812002]|uniref:hypothetical protein n=1 Tax=Pelagicoccus sp. SDUM812002 TaxID=3041266 RepID=UPI002811C2FF|nr:hypothetical protein [Pelagicoccus sp. SDUM812002]